MADPNPSGLSILACYSHESAILAHKNFNLALPSLNWVGISLDDIDRAGIELHEFNSKDLSD